MNVINLDTSAWTVLTEYPLQVHWHHTTRHIEITTTDLAVGTTGKTEEEQTGPDHSLDTTHIVASATVTCTEAAPNHINGTGTSQHRSSSRWPHTAHHGPQLEILPLHTTPITLQILHTLQLIRLLLSGLQ